MSLIIHQDGSYSLTHFRENNRLVCYQGTKSVMYAIAHTLMKMGYKEYANYVETTFGPQYGGSFNLGLCVDLDNKDIFNDSKNNFIPLEKFLELCLPEEKIIKIREHQVIFDIEKKYIKIGCQTILKTKVKEILDLLNS